MNLTTWSNSSAWSKATDLVSKEVLIVPGNLLNTLESLDEEYKILLKFKPTYRSSGFSNVIHLTTGGNSKLYGSRIPAVYYNGEKEQLTITSAVNDTRNYSVQVNGIKVDLWHQVTICQETIKTAYSKKYSSSYYYKVHVNGLNVVSIVNSKPRIFYNVKVFASDPWFGYQIGLIQVFTIFKKDKCMVIRPPKPVENEAVGNIDCTSQSSITPSVKDLKFKMKVERILKRKRNEQETIQFFWDSHFLPSEDHNISGMEAFKIFQISNPLTTFEVFTNLSAANNLRKFRSFKKGPEGQRHSVFLAKRIENCSAVNIPPLTDTPTPRITDTLTTTNSSSSNSCPNDTASNTKALSHVIASSSSSGLLPSATNSVPCNTNSAPTAPNLNSSVHHTTNENKSPTQTQNMTYTQNPPQSISNPSQKRKRGKRKASDLKETIESFWDDNFIFENVPSSITASSAFNIFQHYHKLDIDLRTFCRYSAQVHNLISCKNSHTRYYNAQPICDTSELSENIKLGINHQSPTNISTPDSPITNHKVFAAWLSSALPSQGNSSNQVSNLT